MTLTRTAVVLTTLACLPCPWLRADPTPTEAVSFTGRVIEKETGKPVEGVTVVVMRYPNRGGGQALPAWAGELSLRTDAGGRFTLAFPPEQVAEPRLSVALARVGHPDFVPLKGMTVALASLIQGRKYGDKPYFETIEIERGVETTGRVLEPDGKPAAGVPFDAFRWGPAVASPQWQRDYTGRTDADGRFRLRIEPSYMLQLRLMPERFLPLWKLFGRLQNEAGAPTTELLPKDLGEVRLKPGPRLSGRLIGLDGKPIAGQRVVAWGPWSGQSRTATTDGHGLFVFGPLRHGNYVVTAEDQAQHLANNTDSLTIAPPKRAIRPARAYFRKGEVPAEVVLREVPSVEVEVRFVEATDRVDLVFSDPFSALEGRPGAGGLVTLYGTFPADQDANNRAAAPPQPVQNRLAALVRLDRLIVGGVPRNVDQDEVEEVEQTNINQAWGCRAWPDEAGRVVIRAPKGLVNANLFPNVPNETVAFKTRLTPKDDWNGMPNNSLPLGTLDADRKGLSVLSHRSPTAVVGVKTEDGDTLSEAGVQAQLRIGIFRYGVGMTVQADGRYRTQSMMPDQDYEFWAWQQGYVPNGVEHVRLKEGASAELILIVRPMPKRPEVGDPAPGFVVKTLDGRVLSLDDFRGKFLLLNFWHPQNNQCQQEQTRLKAVSTRFGKEKRFAMLGISTPNEPGDTAKFVETNGITWPQVVLRNQNFDPLLTAYTAGGSTFKTILIGPEGKLIADNLYGDGTADAVAKALGDE